MCCKEDEEEECHQVYIVSHLHDVVASTDQEFVHYEAEKLEKSIGMHKTGQFESI